MTTSSQADTATSAPVNDQATGESSRDVPPDSGKNARPTDATTARAAGRSIGPVWRDDLGRDERAAILSWGAFSLTFAAVRGLTHWLRSGHGPSSGGISVRGVHFHHYNIGIAGLVALGGLTVQAEARERIGEHAMVPIAYGISNALIVDEAALLLDLKDVYWAKQGRISVDVAGGAIGAGGLAIALVPLVQQLRKHWGR